MNFLLKNHGIGALSVQLAVLWCGIDGVGAQQSPPGGFGSYPYSTFTPSMAIIIVILVAALFFMVFFSIYIRRCSDGGGGTGGNLRRALSRRNAAAARGLDPSVVETFPTFSYAEVKDHKIGKGALECAVCLNEFGEDETLRLLPKCDHVFHPECIDAWLAAHVTCPVCRANLVPQPAEEATAAPDTAGDDMDCGSSRNGEIAVQVDGNDPPWLHRNPSLELPAGPARSWSIRGAKVFGLGKFRSHSTGHSLVQPGENLDRFTLRLPEGVRKEVINRASLNRTMSCAAAAALPREGSSRRGYRAGGAEGSSRGGGFYWRLDRADRGMSDQWGFLTRGFSMRSTKVVAESGSGDGSKRTPAKMPSFRWLEPKAADQTSLFKEGPSQSQSPV